MQTNNPDRTTDTGRLVGIGACGGILLAILLFVTGNAEPSESKALGEWGIRVLLLAVFIAGGWNALRGPKTPTPKH